MADEEKDLIDNPASEGAQPGPTGTETEEERETVLGPDEKEDQEPKAEVKEDKKIEREKGDEFWRRERDQLLSAAKADHPQWTQDWLAKRRQERKQETAPTTTSRPKAATHGGLGSTTSFARYTNTSPKARTRNATPQDSRRSRKAGSRSF